MVLRAALALSLLSLLAIPAPTAAATSRETIAAILRDCEEDGVSRSYRPSELRDARRSIGTDLDLYSDCRDVLSAAEARAGSSPSGGGGSPSGGGGASSGGGGASSGGGGGYPSGGGSFPSGGACASSGGGGSPSGGGGASSGGGGSAPGGDGGAPETIAPLPGDNSPSAAPPPDSAPALDAVAEPLLAPGDPEEQSALDQIRQAPPTSAVVGGRPLSLAEGGVLGAFVADRIPAPLLLALALLAGAAALAALPVVRRRLLDRRSSP